MMNRMHHSVLYNEMKRAGIEDTGLSHVLMLFMSELGPDFPSQKSLSDALGISPAAVTTTLRSLERKGYIVKQSDDADNRRKRIRITEKGTALINNSREVARRVNRGMYEGFSDEELNLLADYYSRICGNLEKMGAQPPAGL
jgi:DNA-binding MarR family transcriptional regulator